MVPITKSNIAKTLETNANVCETNANNRETNANIRETNAKIRETNANIHQTNANIRGTKANICETNVKKPGYGLCLFGFTQSGKLKIMTLGCIHWFCLLYPIVQS